MKHCQDLNVPGGRSAWREGGEDFLLNCASRKKLRVVEEDHRGVVLAAAESGSNFFLSFPCVYYSSYFRQDPLVELMIFIVLSCILSFFSPCFMRSAVFVCAF